jgi:uncharacterized membrane-anchored protein YitT (DUF2179 family)
MALFKIYARIKTMKKLISTLLLLNLFMLPINTFAIESNDTNSSSSPDQTVTTIVPTTVDQTATIDSSSTTDQPLTLGKTSIPNESTNPNAQTLETGKLATPQVDGATATIDPTQPSTSYALISFFILMVVTGLILVKSKSMKDSLTKKK